MFILVVTSTIIGTYLNFIKTVKPKGFFELLLVLNIESEMLPFIKSNSNILTAISRSISNALKNVEFRVGLIAYREYVYNQYRKEYATVTKTFSPLTIDHQKVKEILENDLPNFDFRMESISKTVLDGLFDSISATKWEYEKPSIRLIVHTGRLNSRPVGYAQKLTAESLSTLMQIANDMKVRLVTIKIEFKLTIENKTHREEMQKMAEGLTAGDSGHYLEIEYSDTTNIMIKIMKKKLFLS